MERNDTQIALRMIRTFNFQEDNQIEVVLQPRKHYHRSKMIKSKSNVPWLSRFSKAVKMTRWMPLEVLLFVNLSNHINLSGVNAFSYQPGALIRLTPVVSLDHAIMLSKADAYWDFKASLYWKMAFLSHTKVTNLIRPAIDNLHRKLIHNHNKQWNVTIMEKTSIRHFLTHGMRWNVDFKTVADHLISVLLRKTIVQR